MTAHQKEEKAGWLSTAACYQRKETGKTGRLSSKIDYRIVDGEGPTRRPSSKTHSSPANPRAEGGELHGLVRAFCSETVVPVALRGFSGRENYFPVRAVLLIAKQAGKFGLR